jgi:hypothetical protein
MEEFSYTFTNSDEYYQWRAKTRFYMIELECDESDHPDYRVKARMMTEAERAAYKG